MSSKALAFAALALIGADRAHARETAGGTTYRSTHFSIKLPARWTVVLSREEPAAMVGGLSTGAVAMEARGPNGAHLRIWFGCPATEGAGDAMWHLAPDRTGRGVASISENKWTPCAVSAMKACAAEAGHEAGERCPSCSGGDGRFDAWALFFGKAPFSGMPCVELGSTSREDVNQSAFKAILATFRVEGPTGLPGPDDPGWDQAVEATRASGLLPSALEDAGQLVPTARWRTEYAQVADFTYDGKPDIALLGVDGKEAVVVVVEGPVLAKSHALVLRLAVDAGRQDAICSPAEEAHLRTERLSVDEVCPATDRGVCSQLAKRIRRAAAAGALGLRIDGGDCDSVHIYFDGNDLRWWRR